FILDEAGAPVSVIAVGRKGRDFMLRYGRPLIAEFTNLGDRPSLRDIAPIARVATEEFVNGRVDAVYLIYSDFVNTLVQKPNVYRLLPVDPGGGTEGEGKTAERGVEFEFEPSAQGVLAQLLPRYVEIRIYQALLEHVASEQSAKLVAMRNATQNAKDMISDLTLAYNKLRQANITREIIEVSSGAAALTG
ncbi:MAG: F0F1 ATP synthase subunit gamma, partial [Chloroflexota bacterium]|nr:F0F1 ATP synthase subunit gamma [Chloroflexota bacterium]